MRLYVNEAHAMEVVRRFEEKREKTGRRSLVKDAKKYALELGYRLHTLSRRAQGYRRI